MSKILRIASRRSNLAMAQAEWVAAELTRQADGLEVRIVELGTQGDLVLDTPLHLMGGKGVFTREIDAALLDGRADLAVHSLKDLPTEAVDGLVLGAVPQRASTDDVLVGSDVATLADLSQGVTIATGSLRRRAQLLRLRPDLRIVDIRGNVNTRLAKLEANGWAGMILAAAGLDRLGFDDLPRLSLAHELLPAPGQGALGLVAREDDKKTREYLALIEDPVARAQVTAERTFLATIGAGCHAPVGVRCLVAKKDDRNLQDNEMTIEGAVFCLDGKAEARHQVKGRVCDAEQLGQDLAEAVMAAGGRAILDQLKTTSGENQK